MRPINSDAVATASLCNSDYDTKLTILKADGLPDPPDVEGDNCVAGDDDGCGSFAAGSELSGVLLEANTDYIIVVHGFGGATGRFTLNFTCGRFHEACWASIVFQRS